MINWHRIIKTGFTVSVIPIGFIFSILFLLSSCNKREKTSEFRVENKDTLEDRCVSAFSQGLQSGIDGAINDRIWIEKTSEAIIESYRYGRIVGGQIFIQHGSNKQR